MAQVAVSRDLRHMLLMRQGKGALWLNCVMTRIMKLCVQWTRQTTTRLITALRRSTCAHKPT